MVSTYILVRTLAVATSGLCTPRLAINDVALVNGIGVILGELLVGVFSCWVDTSLDGVGVLGYRNGTGGGCGGSGLGVVVVDWDADWGVGGEVGHVCRGIKLEEERNRGPGREVVPDLDILKVVDVLFDVCERLVYVTVSRS